MEYASVRFDGGSTRIIWPDGKSDKVSGLNGKTDNGTADIRIWYLTMGINELCRKGFSIVTLADRDVYLQRRGTAKVAEYAGVRYTGDSTSIVWPDGTIEKVVTDKADKPGSADPRMWYLTRAMNKMSHKGYAIFSAYRDHYWGSRGNDDIVDVWMEHKIGAE